MQIEIKNKAKTKDRKSLSQKLDLCLYVGMDCALPVTFVTFSPSDQTAHHMGAEHSI